MLSKNCCCTKFIATSNDGNDFMRENLSTRLDVADPKKNMDQKKCAQFQEEIVVANDLHAS